MQAVQKHNIKVALACRTFSISETCYRYGRKLDSENEDIADWLLRLTTARKTWVSACVSFIFVTSRASPGITSGFTASIANWN